MGLDLALAVYRSGLPTALKPLAVRLAVAAQEGAKEPPPGVLLGEVWLGVPRLAAELGISDRAVQKSLKALRELGVLRIRSAGGGQCNGRGRPTHYIFVPGALPPAVGGARARRHRHKQHPRTPVHPSTVNCETLSANCSSPERNERQEEHKEQRASRSALRSMAPAKNRPACRRLIWALIEDDPDAGDSEIWYRFKREASRLELTFEVADELKPYVNGARARFAIRQLIALGLDGSALSARVDEELHRRGSSEHPGVVARWIDAEQRRQRLLERDRQASQEAEKLPEVNALASRPSTSWTRWTAPNPLRVSELQPSGRVNPEGFCAKSGNQ